MKYNERLMETLHEYVNSQRERLAMISEDSMGERAKAGYGREHAMITERIINIEELIEETEEQMTDTLSGIHEFDTTRGAYSA